MYDRKTSIITDELPSGIGFYEACHAPLARIVVDYGIECCGTRIVTNTGSLVPVALTIQRIGIDRGCSRRRPPQHPFVEPVEVALHCPGHLTKACGEFAERGATEGCCGHAQSHDEGERHASRPPRVRRCYEIPVDSRDRSGISSHSSAERSGAPVHKLISP